VGRLVQYAFNLGYSAGLLIFLGNPKERKNAASSTSSEDLEKELSMFIIFRIGFKYFHLHKACSEVNAIFLLQHDVTKNNLLTCNIAILAKKLAGPHVNLLLILFSECLFRKLVNYLNSNMERQEKIPSIFSCQIFLK
jgi:hypothetical protein